MEHHCEELVLETFLELCSSRVQMGFTALSWLCANLSDLEPPVGCTLLLGVCTEQSFSKGSLSGSPPGVLGCCAGVAEGEGASVTLFNISTAVFGNLGCSPASQEPGPAEEQRCQQLQCLCDGTRSPFLNSFALVCCWGLPLERSGL